MNSVFPSCENWMNRMFFTFLFGNARVTRYPGRTLNAGTSGPRSDLISGGSCACADDPPTNTSAQTVVHLIVPECNVSQRLWHFSATVPKLPRMSILSEILDHNRQFVANN